MKAMLTGSDHVLPLKLGSKEGSSRKDAAPSSHFDDVLSGLGRKQESKGAAHRAAEPLAKPIVARSTDARRAGLSGGKDEGPEEGGSSPAAQEAEQAPLRLHQSLSHALADQPVDASAAGVSHAGVEAGAHDVPPRSVERVEGRSVVGKPLATVESSAPRDVPQKAAGRLIETPIAGELPPGAEVTASNDSPTMPVRAIERPVAGERRVRAEADPGRKLPLVPPLRPMETAAAAPGVASKPTELEAAMRQPAALPMAASRGVRREPAAGEGPTVQSEQPDAAVHDRRSSGIGEKLSVVGRERHFQPVAAPRDAGALATQAPEARSRAVPALQEQAAQKSPNGPKPGVVARVEHEPKAMTPPASVPQQIAVAIVQEIQGAGRGPVTQAAPIATEARPAETRGPLRTLKVALEPAELGRVTVRLRLARGALEVTVTAERAETASILDRDSHLLGKILQASGYRADDIAVQIERPNVQAAAPALRSAETQAGNQAAPQFPSSGGSEGGRQGPPRSRDGDGHSPRERQGDDANSDPRRGGALYV